MPSLHLGPDKVARRLHEMVSGERDLGFPLIRRNGLVLSTEYRVGARRSGGLPYFVLVLWERHSAESKSGRPDSNRGPLAPKASALTRLRHAPSRSV